MEMMGAVQNRGIARRCLGLLVFLGLGRLASVPEALGAIPTTTSTASTTSIKPLSSGGIPSGTSNLPLLDSFSSRRKWTSSITYEGYRDVLVDKQKPNAVEASSIIHFSVGYKLSPSRKINLDQRVGYDLAVHSQKQDPAMLLNLRLNLIDELEAPSGNSGKLAYRLLLPTNADSRGRGFLGAFSFFPSWTWKLDPQWEVVYEGQAVYSAHDNPKKHASILSNSFSLNYNLSDKISFFQGLGYTYSLMNSSLTDRTQVGWSTWGSQVDVAGGVAWVPSRSFNLSFNVLQALPLMKGRDVLGSPIQPVYLEGTYQIYHPAQTSYNLNAVLIF